MVLATPILDEDGQTIYAAGTILTPEVISSLRFHMSASGITEITVSDQPRQATLVCSRNSHWLVTVMHEDGKQMLYLRAYSNEMASRIARDFTEQVLKGQFSIDKTGKTTLMFVPLPDDAPEFAEDGSIISREFYQVVLAVGTDAENRPILWRYLTWARNADEASSTIRSYRKGIRDAAEKDNLPMILSERIKKVSPIAVTHIVPDTFFGDYMADLEKGGAV